MRCFLVGRERAIYGAIDGLIYRHLLASESLNFVHYNPAEGRVMLIDVQLHRDAAICRELAFWKVLMGEGA